MESIDQEYENLPDIFKLRLKKFLITNPDFKQPDTKYDDSSLYDYELFCITEAIKIAEHCKTAEKVKEFKEDLSHEEQSKIISEGHSGNTFGTACLLAYRYLTEPCLVVIEHGALVPLLGCKKYGCPHPPPEEIINELSKESQEKIRKILEDD